MSELQRLCYDPVVTALRPPPYHPGLLGKGRIYTWAPARWEDSRAIEPYRILASEVLRLRCITWAARAPGNAPGYSAFQHKKRRT